MDTDFCPFYYGYGKKLLVKNFVILINFTIGVIQSPEEHMVLIEKFAKEFKNKKNYTVGIALGVTIHWVIYYGAVYCI